MLRFTLIAVSIMVMSVLTTGLPQTFTWDKPDVARDYPQLGLTNPCIDASKPYAKQPWCNPALTIDERVADMVSRMNLTSEKIPNLRVTYIAPRLAPRPAM